MPVLARGRRDVSYYTPPPPDLLGMIAVVAFVFGFVFACMLMSLASALS